jgi:hypothetical protein
LLGEQAHRFLHDPLARIHYWHHYIERSIKSQAYIDYWLVDDAGAADRIA